MNARSRILAVNGVLFVLLLSLCSVNPAEARFTKLTRFRRGWSYAGGPNGWRGGYWFHGSYLGYAGWWWVVGPYWYYYPNPEGQPVYVVQVDSAPPQIGNSTLPPPPDATPSGLPSSLPSPLSSPVVSPLPIATPSGAADPTTPAKAFMYYCEKVKSYYPLIPTCADGWIVTPVRPPQ